MSLNSLAKNITLKIGASIGVLLESNFFEYTNWNNSITDLIKIYIHEKELQYALNVPKAKSIIHISNTQNVLHTNNPSICICKHYSGNNFEFKIDLENHLFLNCILIHWLNSLTYFNGLGFYGFYKTLTLSL